LNGVLRNILLSFIPLFVAVDVVGLLPVFISLTQGLGRAEKRRVIYQSTLTGGLLAVGFVFLGRAIFRLLGIAIGDFMIAGGSILFCIAIIDLVSPPSEVRRPNAELGAVPLGTPLIAGPAVLTTSLAIIEEYGLWATLISVVLNVALCGALLGLSDALLRFLGRSGSRALSKITSLLLGAIAVMLIRKGVMDLLGRL
jgi:multiple antibiotic resistance protein